MLWRRHTKYKMISPKNKSTVIITCLLIFFQISERSQVTGESLYSPSGSANNPEILYRFLQMQKQMLGNWNIPKGRIETGVPPADVSSIGSESNGSGNAGESSELTRRLESGPEHPSSSLESTGEKPFNFGYGENRGDEMHHNQQNNGAFQHQQQQVQQLLPTGFLFSKQFSRFPNPKTFNQVNGPLVERDVSTEPESNGQQGVYSRFNEFNLPPKHVVIQSRSPHFLVVGSPNLKRNSVAGRDGYMCHFKLCQLGASGKRRWSPLFEYD